jgi:hypothetical protein
MRHPGDDSRNARRFVAGRPPDTPLPEAKYKPSLLAQNASLQLI